jgi:hypothetical protein
LGYFWLNSEQGAVNSGPSYDAGLVKISARTTYSIALQDGYAEDYFTAENLGATKYNRAIGNICHRLRERITLGMDGTVQRSEKSGIQSRRLVLEGWGTCFLATISVVNPFHRSLSYGG